MNTVDIVLSIPLAYGIYRGFRKGLIMELITLLALFIAIFVGVKFSADLEGLLSEKFNLTSKLLPVISFGVLFILILIVVFLIGKLLEHFLKLAKLNILNRVAGAALGLLKYGLVAGLFVFVFNPFDQKIKMLSDETRKESLLYEPVLKASVKILPGLKNIWNMLPGASDEEKSEQGANNS